MKRLSSEDRARILHMLCEGMSIRAITRLTGFTPEELYADPDSAMKLVHGDDGAIVHDLLARGAGRTPVVVRWLRKDGSTVWVEQRSTRVFDAAHQLVAVEGVAREIVDTLALRQIGGDSPWLELEELRSRIPAFAEEHGHGVLPVLADLLGRIAPRTRGVIVFDPQSQKASFDPRGAGAPEVAAFNAALPLIRRFDSTLTAAQEMPETEGQA